MGQGKELILFQIGQSNRVQYLGTFYIPQPSIHSVNPLNLLFTPPVPPALSLPIKFWLVVGDILLSLKIARFTLRSRSLHYSTFEGFSDSGPVSFRSVMESERFVFT